MINLFIDSKRSTTYRSFCDSLFMAMIKDLRLGKIQYFKDPTSATLNNWLSANRTANDSHHPESVLVWVFDDIVKNPDLWEFCRADIPGVHVHNGERTGPIFEKFTAALLAHLSEVNWTLPCTTEQLFAFAKSVDELLIVNSDDTTKSGYRYFAEFELPHIYDRTMRGLLFMERLQKLQLFFHMDNVPFVHRDQYMSEWAEDNCSVRECTIFNTFGFRCWENRARHYRGNAHNGIRSSALSDAILGKVSFVGKELMCVCGYDCIGDTLWHFQASTKVSYTFVDGIWRLRVRFHPCGVPQAGHPDEDTFFVFVAYLYGLLKAVIVTEAEYGNLVECKRPDHYEFVWFVKDIHPLLNIIEPVL